MVSANPSTLTCPLTMSFTRCLTALFTLVTTWTITMKQADTLPPKATRTCMLMSKGTLAGFAIYEAICTQRFALEAVDQAFRAEIRIGVVSTVTAGLTIILAHGVPTMMAWPSVFRAHRVVADCTAADALATFAATSYMLSNDTDIKQHPVATLLTLPELGFPYP